jgi:ketosteroid isomerase-like protein
MDSRIQELLDHHEIIKTLNQYSNACDRCDEPRMADVYFEDSWDDHGRRKAPGPEFARLTTESIRETTETMYHLLGQSIIDLNGDFAGAETYFFAVSRTVEDDGTRRINQLGGRFVDQLERDGDRWRIRRRQVVRDWTISLPLEHDWMGALALTPGARSDEDPSFAVLNLVHGQLRPSGSAV